MNGDADGLSPAEEQLVALLALLRAEQIEPRDTFADAVIRAVRWQLLARGTIVLIGDLAGSMATALRLFLTSRPRSPEDSA